MWLKSH